MAMNSQFLSKEQVLIVGCGDIGDRLAQRLSPSAYAVKGLRRHPPSDAAYLSYIACDVTQPHALEKRLPGADIIVITMTPSEPDDSGYERAYVDTCRHLVAGLAGSKPRLVIFVSSTAVYAQDDGSLIDEDDATSPENFNGKRLLEAENIIRNSGLPHIIVRFSGIYGPGRNRLVDRVRNGKASLSSHYTNRIHVDDCAGVLAHLIERQKTVKLDNLYIATDSNPVPQCEVSHWLAQQLNVTLPVDSGTIPASSEQGGKRCSNRRLLATGYQFAFPGYQQGYIMQLGKC